jgi:hypothetical protein
MGLLNVHSELFLLNKSLIPVVFAYAVKEIYTKILSLFSNVPQFGTQAAVQSYVDIFCLREAFKLYTVDESKELFQRILKLVPSSAFEQHKTLMTKIISDFLTNMNPYIVVIQTPIQVNQLNEK